VPLPRRTGLAASRGPEAFAGGAKVSRINVLAYRFGALPGLDVSQDAPGGDAALAVKAVNT